MGQIGNHDAYETWQADGRPTLLDELNEKLDQLLASHRPLPLTEEVEKELARIQERAAGVP
jgi:trimethylamine:corrinoid methyltransferase-like protein